MRILASIMCGVTVIAFFYVCINVKWPAGGLMAGLLLIALDQALKAMLRNKS